MRISLFAAWLALSLLLLAPAQLAASHGHIPAKNSSTGIYAWLAGGVATVGLATTCLQWQWNTKRRAKSIAELNTQYEPTIEKVAHKIENFIYQSDFTAFKEMVNAEVEAQRYQAYSDEVVAAKFEAECKQISFFHQTVHGTISRVNICPLMKSFIKGNDTEVVGFHEQPARPLPQNAWLNSYLGNFGLREKNPMLASDQISGLKGYYQGANRLRDGQGKTFSNDPLGTIKRFFSRY